MPFKERPELKQIVKEKVIAVKGDLVQKTLGIDPIIRKRLTEEVQIILNSAASVNFDDPIKESLDINYHGAVRILELAHDCKNILALNHVSTVGVNLNLPHNAVAPEDLLPFALGHDWEAVVGEIDALNDQQAKVEEAKILKRYNYPNTYSFCKGLAEHYLEKYRRPDLPVVILRPAAVSSCEKYPFPGWCDSIGAAGGILQGLGKGAMINLLSAPDRVCWIVPCDFVINAVLVSTVQSVLQQKAFDVINVDSSGT